MHYAISDVHAHTKTFEEFLKILKPEDKVYFIGDAIDKGDGSLEVLKYIMRDNRFTFLMGNHEYMFFSYLYYSRILERIEENPDISDKTVLFYDVQSQDAFSDHVMNDGWRTIESYVNENENIRNKIFDFLSHLPIQIEISINGRDFVLVHAFPDLECKKITNGVLKIDQFNLDDPDEFEHEKFVWMRDFFKSYENKIVITGHNIVQYFFKIINPACNGKYILENDNDGWYKCITPGDWYDIDCGMALRDPEISKLAVLRLDDMAFKLIDNTDPEEN